jgi:hypothetical protein
MKSKEELQKYIREEVSNPLIGKFIMEMTDKGISYEDTMQMAKILIDNTPNVECKLRVILVGIDNTTGRLKLMDGSNSLMRDYSRPYPFVKSTPKAKNP